MYAIFRPYPKYSQSAGVERIDIIVFFVPPLEASFMATLVEEIENLPDGVNGDLLESEEAFQVVIDMPGTTRESFEAQVQGEKLVFEAQREKDIPAEFEYRSEEREMLYEVTIPIPKQVNEEEIHGDIERGVLRLMLPKSSNGDGDSA